MYELIQVSDTSYYIQSPAKIGLVKLNDVEMSCDFACWLNMAGSFSQTFIYHVLKCLYSRYSTNFVTAMGAVFISFTTNPICR